MAEYYAVWKKAVGGLEGASSETRRAVYDKARNALIGQLKAIDPPLSTSEISRQRLELDVNGSTRRAAGLIDVRALGVEDLSATEFGFDLFGEG